MPATQGFQGISDFHVYLELLFGGYIRSPPETVNAIGPPVVSGPSLIYSSFREFKPCSVAATVF